MPWSIVWWINNGRLGLLVGILLVELVGGLVLGQEVIPDESAGDRQAEELPCLAGGARQEPVADLAVVDRWTRLVITTVAGSVEQGWSGQAVFWPCWG